MDMKTNFINPNSPEAAQVPISERNPYFWYVDNGAYELGRIFRQFPERRKPLTPDDVLKLEAISQHAYNSIGTLLHGMAAIGSLMVRVGCCDDGDLGPGKLRDIGDLLCHLAGEIRSIRDLENQADETLRVGEKQPAKEA